MALLGATFAPFCTLPTFRMSNFFKHLVFLAPEDATHPLSICFRLLMMSESIFVKKNVGTFSARIADNRWNPILIVVCAYSVTRTATVFMIRCLILRLTRQSMDISCVHARHHNFLFLPWQNTDPWLFDNVTYTFLRLRVQILLRGSRTSPKHRLTCSVLLVHHRRAAFARS